MKKWFLFLIVLGVSASPAYAKSAKKVNCFGAVGKQCAVPGSVKGTPSPLNMVACSKIEKGRTNCWTSPGSIIHDNCCAKHPNGVMCSHETKNDGNCAKEWENAYKDITQKMAWYHIYNVKEGANLSLISSKRMKKFGGKETQTSTNLCAPGGTKILARYDLGFCCAGKAKKQGEVMICSEETQSQIAAKAKKSKSSLDNIFKQIDDLIKRLASLQGSEKMAVEEKIDNLKAEAKKLEKKEQIAMKPQPAPPPPPQLPLLPKQFEKPMPPQQKIAEQKKPLPQSQQQSQPVASRPIGTQTTFDYGSGPNMPPPQPMQEEQDELEQPTYYEEPAPPPEPAAQREPETQPQPEVAREESKPDCPGGTWSPTFGRCIENQIEEAAPPPTCERGSWSPTLRMCVE